MGGVFVVLAVGALMACAGCTVEFPEEGHDRCVTDADCLSGRTCVATYCLEPGEMPDTGGVDQTQPDTAEDTADDGVDRDDVSADALDTAADDTLPPPTDTARDTEPDVPPGPDGDGDGVPDASDNCPALVNPAQEDFDGNGVGDVCQQDQHTGLVITEVLANPEQGLGVDMSGNEVVTWQRQYVEIHNASEQDIDLSGVVLENLAGVQVTVSPQTPAIVAAGGVFVISGDRVPGADGITPLPGYRHGEPGFLIEAGDGSADGVQPFERLRLLRPLEDRPDSPLLIDEVEFARPFLAGTSRSLVWSVTQEVLPAEGNDNRVDWCDAGEAIGRGRDGGTPGVANTWCFEPLAGRCTATPPVLALGRYAFGDLLEPQVAADNTNRCTEPVPAAQGSDLTWRVEVASVTDVELRFDPVPTVEGDQIEGGGLTREPWLGLVYWREDVCPTQQPINEPSLCLSSTDMAQTSTVRLEPGVTYYFTVDGQTRPVVPARFEEGRFTLGLFALP